MSDQPRASMTMGPWPHTVAGAWLNPYTLVNLPRNPRIRYTRKSTDDEGRQVASHEQQYAECDKLWGPLPEACERLWFRDDKSGTTFDRPAFKEMVEFCLANPQRGGSRGLIEIYDHSRWGRPVRKDGRGRIVGVDIRAFYRPTYRLEEAGWEVVFSTGEKTEDELAAFLKEGMQIYMAGKKSEDLSREVRRGRFHWLRKGRWVGGPPPFPAKRVHPDTKQDLPPGTRAANGGSLLAPDLEKLPHWLRAAEMVLGGMSLIAIAEMFNRLGVPNYYRGRTKDGRVPRWTYQHVRKILTNRALIAELHHTSEDPATGELRTEVIAAAWEPIVPRDLFQAVQEKLVQSAHRAGRRRSRDGVSSYVIPLLCARCGTALYGVDTPRKDGGENRRYRHQNAAAPIRRDSQQRIIEAGCRAWQVDAGEIEAAIRDLIAAQRGSPDFKRHVDEVLTGREGLEEALGQRVEAASVAVARIKAQQQEAVRLKIAGGNAGLSDQLFFETLQALEVQEQEATRMLEEAEAAIAGAECTRSRARKRIDETTALLERWDNGDVADRMAIINWWVDAALVDFTESSSPPASRRRRGAHTGQRSAQRHLIVFLASLPDGGMMLDLEPSRSGQITVGPRTWELVTVRTTHPLQSPEESGTSRSPNGWAGCGRNCRSRRARFSGCRR
jgi:DNA invertase Pin-like site-specific DNA recombinase